ncbi:type I-F CRISPR-associated helicase Cas3f [Roseateles albus]|uniref:Type I-F CRISPR-associated helicase Cas3f n=1 Tax=Roseateles albus TaxID=2987525 RepID=A0ABT5KJ66_9BURK|nr:type I-F CRISPR-associated helicase Cas3f [Roseateles albus]MDC8773554.1 type I-F CRISPR-associated helicase Cas3f [Roseateles albus]
MNVLLISQCDKRALTETRRILDQFAERRGDRTWQTAITQDGLDTLRRLLRKTARKNTAVACHWIRALDHSELLWSVGDRTSFNELGAVPTNTTSRNILRTQDQNDWHSGELIQLLTDMAGLLHDIGKAIEAFQMRLEGKLVGRNLIRHEWVSLRLFAAFVGDDDDATWLERMATPTEADLASWMGSRLQKDGLHTACTSPFAALSKAPLAQALAWLVVTHHRLPVLPFGEQFSEVLISSSLNRIESSWNEDEIKNATAESIKPFWSFPHGLPVSTPEWRQRAARVAKRLQRYAGLPMGSAIMSNPFALHLSRLCLMLADHHYSSLEVGSDGKPDAQRVKVAPASKLVANTRMIGKGSTTRVANQSLDEHLLGVAQHGAEVARFLPNFERKLARLGKHRRLKARSQEERFRWQDKAADLAGGMRTRSEMHGAFVVNMASTGCGKTLANAKVMYGLADPVLGMRCAFAMGLRTLTLQTGQAFRELLGLSDDELAIRVGGGANRALFEHFEAQAAVSGSESRQDLFDEDGHVLFEGQQDSHPLLRRAIADPNVHALLTAPVLVCTIDHLTPATESQRGGRQIAPMLRLMSGDLVLDEPDDFDLADLPALTRLVHWAGLLGARVLLSSATLPPALIQGLFEAYRNGRSHFQANCGERPGADQTPPQVCVLWLDEFKQHQADCSDPAAFEREHLAFVQERAAALAELSATPRRRLKLVPLEGLPKVKLEAAQMFAALVLKSASELHQAHHSIDSSTGKRVSFGLVRMANIEPLHDVALALFKLGAATGQRIHLCVYHSRFPLLIRSAIERQLDSTLKRQRPEAVFDLPEVRARLDSNVESDQIFIVLGSPVTEVGRDHDYDWAAVEPSSMRSLIQLLGRVRRHRAGACGGTPNVHVFSSNLRHFAAPGQAAFCKPGFEQNSGSYRLASHDLRELLATADCDAVDARPRILAPAAADLQPQQRLVDLEHARMRQTMLVQLGAALPATGRHARGPGVSASKPFFNASTWWQAIPGDALLTGLIPQQQPFRAQTGPDEISLVLLPDEGGEHAVLHRVLENTNGRRGEKLYVAVELSEHRAMADGSVQGERMQAWGVTDYMRELSELAEAMGLPMRWCAERFGQVSVRENDEGWQSHAALGFAKRRRADQ